MKTLGNVYKRVNQNYYGCEEPEQLQQDSGFINFEEIKKVIDKDLLILEEAQLDFENDQKEMDEYQSNISTIADLFQELQSTTFEEYERISKTPEASKNLCSRESLDQTALRIQSTKQMAEHRKSSQKQAYQSNKSLKQIQELIIILKSLNQSVVERRELVQKYV